MLALFSVVWATHAVEHLLLNSTAVQAFYVSEFVEAAVSKNQCNLQTFCRLGNSSQPHPERQLAMNMVVLLSQGATI